MFHCKKRDKNFATNILIESENNEEMKDTNHH